MQKSFSGPFLDPHSPLGKPKGGKPLYKASQDVVTKIAGIKISYIKAC